MLAADKDRLIAGLKQHALSLRHKELDYFVERYSNLATQASILAGFAFDSLVELDVEGIKNESPAWVRDMYYICGALTMTFALYTVCIASFATVWGHRLALQGPTGSVDKAVAVMMKFRNSIFFSFACGLFCLILSATAMAWIKMGDAASAVTAVFGLFFISIVVKYQRMKMMFAIPQDMMVRGDVRVNCGSTEVDVATLEAGFGAGHHGLNIPPGASYSEGHGGGAIPSVFPLLPGTQRA
ncbi:hypothetical protein AB1Y20_002868 [Prymnesium parvum]|uniref:Transmembrane protein n=1 Tax=Prymnesium parvum TaxID=97485 RepID=A0AB34J970_PRYPA